MAYLLFPLPWWEGLGGEEIVSTRIRLPRAEAQGALLDGDNYLFVLLVLLYLD